MSTVLDDLNTQLSGYIQDVEAIKEKIKQVAQSKNITIVENVDTPISVLNKINAGTIATPAGTLSVTTNDTYNVSNYAFVSVNVQGGSGGTKYAHHIKWYMPYDPLSWFHDVCGLTIITDSSLSMSYQDLSQWLIESGYISNNEDSSQNVWFTNVAGVIINQSSDLGGFYTGICAENGNSILGLLDNGEIISVTGNNFTDTVEQIN